MSWFMQVWYGYSSWIKSFDIRSVIVWRSEILLEKGCDNYKKWWLIKEFWRYRSCDDDILKLSVIRIDCILDLIILKLDVN